MAQTVRAIYENGILRLLDPVTLHEGEQTLITILPGRELVRLALKDILVPDNAESLLAAEDEALLAEIESELPLKSIHSVSDVIIEERGK